MKHVSKTQQIPTELFTALVSYFLLDDRSPEREAYIQAGLQDKLDRAAARQRYGEELDRRKDNSFSH